MSCIVNGQTLLEYESIFNEISKNKFEQFLIYLFETILPRKLTINRDIFSKLFSKIPYLPRMKLFDYLRNDRHYESHLIRLEDLIQNLLLIIFGTIEEKIHFVINFFNFNNDKKIYYKDVKLTFFYFHLFSLRKDEINLDKIIDDCFKGKEYLTQNEFLNLIKKKNSDLFYLLLFSFNQHFFYKNYLKIINHNINNIYYKSYTQVSFLYETLSNPSKVLFEYINNNYNLFLQYYDNLKELDELNELNSFENDFKVFRSTLMSSNYISEDEDDNRKGKKITSFSETKCKFNKNSFSTLSNDYKINNHNSPTQHIYSTCLNSTIKNLKLNEDNDFKKIAIEIYGINYECKIIYSENYLIVKYSSEKKERKFLIIPFNLSFPIKLNKGNNQNNYEVIIKNQIPRYEKDFIFKFISENDRNIFYDKIYLLTKSFEIESKFNFIEELGIGEFGTTYLAIKKVQNSKKNSFNLEALIEIKNIKIEEILGKKYAIKVLKKKNLQKRDNIFHRNEVEISKILVRAKHKNIINIQKVLEDVNNIYIIMEYCPKKNINININELSINEKLKQITQIINGIKFLHKLGIIHRDLKLNHLLIGEDNNIRIIDFGFSLVTSPYSYINDIFGSFGYFPPEILEKKSYSFPVDYWNIGVISYFYLYNNIPFENLKNVNDIKKFNLYKFLFDNCDNNNINNYANSIKNIILSCMKIDMNNRGKDLDNYLNIK